MVLVGTRGWKVFAKASMMSMFSPIMFTPAQTQCRMEYMQSFRTNTQPASGFMKYMGGLIKKKPKTSERGLGGK